jgi:putative peptide zinc metalloprotease protein
MSSLADSLVSSASRPLAVRMRADLTTVRQRYQGKTYWVVKEPISLAYFRFEEEEFAILEMLDGRTSLDEMRARFESRFPPQKITSEELQQFIGSLHRSSLVVADLPGQGRQLNDRHDDRLRRERKQAWTNVLSLRFKGIDPQPVLDWLYPRTAWLFHPMAVAVCLALILSALALITVQFDVFQAKLPSFSQFFEAQNWLLLAAVLAVTKILHEFGHALVNRHFGGECHEMGVMLLVLTPCLYCNVSDSWMLPSKWRRAAIGAAGMYVELVIASVCTFLWWFSQPGLLNYMCLSTMFVCSVSTLLFNGNPLLRYDGYYILSDLVEIPNLRQKASTILNRKLGSWCLGLEEPHDPFLPRRHQTLFAVYTVAAAIYRWFVTLAILYFLYKLFEPYRLEFVGELIALAAMYGLIGRPLWRLAKFFHVPGRIYQVKRARLRASLATLAVAAAFVLFVPLPSAVYCTLEIKPRGAAPVYVDVPGRLEAILAQPGQTVLAGAPLATLENEEVRIDLAALAGQRDGFAQRLANLEQQRFRDERALLEIEQVRESLGAVEDQLAQRERDLAKLQVTAPTAGTVLSAPFQAPQATGELELASWSGTPLEARNLGATLAESTLVCQIGDPTAYEAVLVIDQADIELVREGQAVEVLLNQSPGEAYSTRIEAIAHEDLDATSARLSGKAGGELATRTDATGRVRPLSASYQALAPLDDEEGVFRAGLRGRAKVHTRWQTLASRGWRYLSQTFQFEL